MFKLKCLVNNIVVGEEKKLQHFLLVKKQLVTEIGLGISLEILPFSHLDPINYYYYHTFQNFKLYSQSFL